MEWPGCQWLAWTSSPEASIGLQGSGWNDSHWVSLQKQTVGVLEREIWREGEREGRRKGRREGEIKEQREGERERGE